VDRAGHAQDPIRKDHAPGHRRGVELHNVGDVTTLANPEVVDDIRHHVQGEKVARGEAPRALTPHEIDEIKAFGQAE
jgi:protein required for attachment to host cells